MEPHWNGTGKKHVVFKKEDEKSHLVVGVALGEGGYGVVKMLLCRSLQMARKKVKGRHDSVKSLVSEVQVMEKLAHRHLVKLVGTYTWRSKLYILTFPVAMCDFEQVLDEYEKLQGGESDIYSDNDEKAQVGKVAARALLGFARTKLFLEKGSEYGADELVIAMGHRLNEILGCLATAVEWMHAEGVRHLDLKPANIVLNPGEVYITDFGLSRQFKDRTTTRTEFHSGFSAGYAAPEVHQQEAYHPSSADIYSLGSIYLHVATVRHGGNRDRCRVILKSMPTSQKPQKRQQAIEAYLTKELWPRFVEAQMRKGDDTGRLPLEFRDLLMAMLSDQPDQRPTANAVNERLRRLGGWQQRYHGSCCKKNRYALSLLSHTRKAYSDDANEPSDNLCGYLGVTLHKLAISSEEELSLRDDLQRAQRRYGEDDTRTIDIITDLVSCLRGQKNYTEARSISLQLLRRTGADSSDPEVLELIRNTGILHFLCGQYDDAESTLKRAVTQSKHLLGRQNPETLETIDDLALVLHARGRLVEAEELYRSLEADKRTALGKDYSGTLDTLHRLSLVLSDQGKNEEAEKLAVETLENRKRLLGIDHPDLLESMEHLARVLDSTGKAGEAVEILDQLRIHKASLRRRLLGDGHAFNHYISERIDELRQQRQAQLLELEAALRAAELEELVNQEHQASPDSSERNSFAAVAAGKLGRLNPDAHLNNDHLINDPEALRPDPGTEADFIRPNNKFAFTPGMLNKLINPKSLSAFYHLGGLAGIEKGLRSNRETGLSVDETYLDGTVSFESVKEAALQNGHADGAKRPIPVERSSTRNSNPHHVKETKGAFADRKDVFSDNRLPEKKGKTIWEIMWIIHNDKVLILLSVASVICLAVGLYQTFDTSGQKAGKAKIEWLDGVAIIVAIVVLVGSINDFQAKRQFVKLKRKKQVRDVNVIRSGKSREVSVYDLLVGDVVLLEPGDMVPVDGIFIEGHNIKCDESSATGESDLIRKRAADDVYAAIAAGEDTKKLDPFILSGSYIIEGVGKFMVTSTGVNSSYGKIMMSLREDA